MSDNSSFDSPRSSASNDSDGKSNGTDVNSSQSLARMPPTVQDAHLLGAKSKAEILAEFEEFLKNNTKYHLGYPYNLKYCSDDMKRFLEYSINNLGDPFVPSNYGVHSRQFEIAVLAWFASLWEIKEGEYWGYVTNSGTEGNLQAMLVARENFPDGILYASRESHYSIFKAAHFFRMPAVPIATTSTGVIDYEDLEKKVAANTDKPVILNVNIGTTVKGAVDDLTRILRILTSLGIPRERWFIHCDGALFALMLPFVNFAPRISFSQPIDSMAVSGHKFLGAPMPCGVMMTRKSHMEIMHKPVEYLNSVDTTITGSRNGHAPLFLWNALVEKGSAGLMADVDKCLYYSKYLRDALRKLKVSCMLNDLSSTVVLERPDSDAAVQKWQLACEGPIAHVVIMPSIEKDKLDEFLVDVAQWSETGLIGTKCVCAKIGRRHCRKCRSQ